MGVHESGGEELTSRLAAATGPEPDPDALLAGAQRRATRRRRRVAALPVAAAVLVGAALVVGGRVASSEVSSAGVAPAESVSPASPTGGVVMAGTGPGGAVPALTGDCPAEPIWTVEPSVSPRPTVATDGLLVPRRTPDRVTVCRYPAPPGPSTAVAKPTGSAARHSVALSLTGDLGRVSARLAVPLMHGYVDQGACRAPGPSWRFLLRLDYADGAQLWVALAVNPCVVWAANGTGQALLPPDPALLAILDGRE